MSFVSAKHLKAWETGEYPCERCDGLMEFEDENEDTLVCPKCGYSVAVDKYGFSDEEYAALYPTKEEVLGYDEDDEDEDEDESGETYDEVFNELDD